MNLNENILNFIKQPIDIERYNTLSKPSLDNMILEKFSKTKNKETELYNAKWFKVLDIGGMICTKKSLSNVVVLPYKIKDNNEYEFGVNYEFNPIRETGYWLTAITGDIEKGETDLEGAKRELYEESGYDIDDDSLFESIGNLVTSKYVVDVQPCFIVNVTDIEQKERTTDGTESEKQTTFKFVNKEEIIKCNDCYLQSLLLRFISR